MHARNNLFARYTKADVNYSSFALPNDRKRIAATPLIHYSYMMTKKELRFLTQEKDYQSPFPTDDPEFRDWWWNGNSGRLGEDPFGSTEYVEFLVDGKDVGRAKLTNWQLSASYVGIDTKRFVKEIWFFEIRSSACGQGHGTEFASLLAEQFTGTPLIAFSEGADEFWENIGWIYYPRKDGDASSYWKLFVSEPLK